MANTYVAINRGAPTLVPANFTVGSSSSASSDFELRIAALDGQGNVPTRKDVFIALEAFQNYLMSDAWANINVAPPL